MSKPEPARFRTTNWSEDNAVLRGRGSLLVWLDRDLKWLARPSGRPGRPEAFCDAAIQFCLSIKALFGLALRQTIGMVSRLLKLAGMDWPVPDCSTLCRRQKTVTIRSPYRRSGGNLHLLVDSIGVKMAGDGEWQVRKHGPGRRTRWRKVHLAIDAATSVVRAVEFTSSREGDSPVLPDLLAQVPADQPIGTVTADGAYGTRKCHAAIVERGAAATNTIVSVRSACSDGGGATGRWCPLRDDGHYRGPGWVDDASGGSGRTPRSG